MYNPIDAPGNRTIDDREMKTLQSIVLPIELVYTLGKWRPLIGLNMQRYVKAMDYSTRGGASFTTESIDAPLLIAGLKSAINYQLMQTKNAMLQVGPYVMFNYNFTDIRTLHVGFTAVYGFRIKERNKK